LGLRLGHHIDGRIAESETWSFVDDISDGIQDGVDSVGGAIGEVQDGFDSANSLMLAGTELHSGLQDLKSVDTTAFGEIAQSMNDVHIAAEEVDDAYATLRQSEADLADLEEGSWLYLKQNTLVVKNQANVAIKLGVLTQKSAVVSAELPYLAEKAGPEAAKVGDAIEHFKNAATYYAEYQYPPVGK